MLSIHAGHGTPEEWGDRFETCFIQAIDDAHLPDDADFRKALREYIHWATRDANTVAPEGVQAEPDRPMPRWSWDGPVTADPAADRPRPPQQTWPATRPRTTPEPNAP